MYSSFFKRVIDLVISLVLITVCSWLFLVIILVYLFTFNLPIFFRQARIGKGEQMFDLIKFRTLDVETKQSFWLGSFLRFTSLDELPQLFQVVSGKLALVGPRPLPVEYLNLFSEEQRKRHSVLPGITGWAQVNGRNSISWQKKFELDVYYVEHQSFWFDTKILLKTVLLIFSFKKDVSLTEEKFTGV
jgi:undecaprenyl phosphate N,N'-diacetylbacillosamine 1-phosphate transferase